MFWLLVIVGLAFAGYAIYTQYNKTPEDLPVPQRVWASLVAAAGAIGAAVVAWFQTS
jgi:hypothetical protein